MKKNNSFKLTFYLGLCIMLIIITFLTLIIVNVWRTVEPKLKKNKVEVIVSEQHSLDDEIIHDTIFIEKLPLKPVDSQKIVEVRKVNKKQVNIVETKDTVISVDTLK